MKTLVSALVPVILMLVISTGANALATTLPIPTSQEGYVYPPTAIPVTSSSPSLIKPIGVGDVAAGGDVLDIRVGLDKFASPVDAYVLFLFPTLSPDLFLWTGSSLQPLAGGLVPWKQNISAPINESLLGTLSVSGLGLPVGAYYLGLIITPAGVSDLSAFYIWVTEFDVVSDVVPMDGRWSGPSLQFYVSDQGTKVSPDYNYFYPNNLVCSMAVGPFAECGNFYLCIQDVVPINNGKFSYNNFYAQVTGTFSSATMSSGTYWVDINLPGCVLTKQGQWNSHFVD